MSVSLPTEILKRYKNGIRVFFETGTSEGDTVQTALDCGFEEVYSVELDEETALRARKRFKALKNVHIMCGSSVDLLKIELQFIEEPVLFWLDAHPDWGAGVTPILQEIEVICSHPYRDSILADDMRLMGLGRWSLSSVSAITQAVMKKNTNYRVVLETNGHAVDDLFAATLGD